MTFHRWRDAIHCIPVLLLLTLGCSGEKSYRCPTKGMMPTMGPDDIFKATIHPYKSDPPLRGDIVVFQVPEMASLGKGHKAVKRIVGLPGNQVEFRRFRLFVDGKTIDEPYIELPKDIQRFEGSAASPDTDPVPVPDGYVFVAGDNRSNSVDSRYFGSIPITSIEARASVITRSKEKERVGRRLDRNRKKEYD